MPGMLALHRENRCLSSIGMNLSFSPLISLSESWLRISARGTKGQVNPGETVAQQTLDPRRIATICTSWPSNFVKINFRLALTAFFL